MADRPNVFTYPRNEPGTMGHLDLVEPLRVMPRQLAEALRDASEGALQHASAEGGWCVKEIAGHLADAARIYHKRLYMMSTQTDPVLEPYDEEALVREGKYRSRDLADILREVRAWRSDTVDLLTSLVNWNWARTGQHLERGRTSIRQLVEHMVHHESEHLTDLINLRSEYDASQS